MPGRSSRSDGPTSDGWRLACRPTGRSPCRRAARGPAPIIWPQSWTACEDDDPFIAQAARLAIGRLGVVDGDLDVSRLPPRQRLAALLVLRDTSQPPGRLLSESLGDVDPRVRFAALQWVGEDKLSDYRGELKNVLAAGPMSGELFAAYLAALEKLDDAQSALMQKERSSEQYVAQTLADRPAPTEARRWALRVLRPDHPLFTIDFLRHAIDSDDVEFQREAIRSLAASPHAERTALLAEIARDPKRPASLRAEATAGLAAEQHDLLLELAGSDQSAGTARSIALAGRRHARCPAAGIAPRATAHGDPRLQQLIARVLDPQFAANRPAADDLDAWVRLLDGPADADEGQRIFHSRIVGCARCHTIDGRGGRIGPDLSRSVGRSIDDDSSNRSCARARKSLRSIVTWTIETDGRTTAVGTARGRVGRRNANVCRFPRRELFGAGPFDRASGRCSRVR